MNAQERSSDKFLLIGYDTALKTNAKQIFVSDNTPLAVEIVLLPSLKPPFQKTAEALRFIQFIQ